MKTGIDLITQERKEQIKKHGFDLDHDETHHSDGALIKAAIFALTLQNKWEQDGFEDFEEKIRTKLMRNRFIIAGALIAAEIDRLDSDAKVNCCLCGELVKPTNAIYRKLGIFYYCKKTRCQERFIEDTGERPESDYE